MTISYTTHLICAPDLPEAAEVAVFHVKPGQHVLADSLLITLLAADREWPVLSPDAGEVTSLMVEYGDFVNSNDLLLMMEIAEKPTSDWLLADQAQTEFPARAARAAPATVDASKDAPRVALSVSPAAATLAAKLGLDLSRIEADGLIDEDAVLEFARQELMKLNKLRNILT
jgi:pyruvate/2-oxoglutarate dehydrogenase complex dihydrolipoamide acyltransferase (E2) component